MEIKIKDKDNLIDATIEIVNGVMVVSPKEEKYEPKDGDVVFSGSSLISIFKEMTSGTSFASYAALSNGEFEKEFDFWNASNIRPATEEEKKKLFDKLKEKGLEFDFEKKELVKLRWKPKCNETFHFPSYECGYFESDSGVYLEDAKDLIDEDVDVVRGWVFRTKEECEQFCNRLNQAIEGVKP